MARPTEIRTVRAFLENGIQLDRKDGETEEDYRNRYLNEGAKSIIAALDECRKDRTDYVVVRQAGNLADGYGPYATYLQAQKAIEGGKIPALDGTRFLVLPIRHPIQAEETMAKIDEGGLTPEAMKMWAIARNGGMQARTHSRRNRRRVA